MSIDITYRPLDDWPRDATDPRYGNPFGKVEWGSTLTKLRKEVGAIGGERVIVALDISDDDLRLDGTPRAAVDPRTPRVMVSFESEYGPIKMYCDRFDKWRVNVRAIANGLESLRRVDRFGITQRGEQYTGWTALPSQSIALGPASLTRKEAAELLVKTAGEAWYGVPVEGEVDDPVADAVAMLLEHPENLDRVYKFAARNAHPDLGGNHAAMTQVAAARDVLAAKS